jgi:hypothetical protein
VFTDREAAGKTLRDFGPIVEAAVRTALRETASAEVRQRLEKIAESLNKPVPVNVVEVRAVELLEWIGSGRGSPATSRPTREAAKEYLAVLAGGEPTAPLTRDAAAALKRLAASRQ